MKGGEGKDEREGDFKKEQLEGGVKTGDAEKGRENQNEMED